jgi:hypothetical protein
MSEQHDQRDHRIGDAVERVLVPSRGEDFMPALLSRLDAVDAETPGAAETSSGHSASDRASSLWRHGARRRASLLGAAAVAAALLLVLVLAGVPGMRTTEPSPATAADRLMAAIDAGLAKVHTMRGRIMFDAPYQDTTSPPAWATFAATSAGDRMVDVHRRVDWDGARRAYLAQVASLRKARASYTPAQYKSQMAGLRQMTAVPRRSVWVISGGEHTASLAYFIADPVTHALARARYYDFGWDLGLGPNAQAGETERVWELATQLRSVISADAGVAVGDTTYQGRPAWHVTVAPSKGVPGWYAIVDKEYGITLAVQSPSKARTGLIAFHVTDLRVNEPLPAGTFAIRPSYETAMRMADRRGGTLVVKKMELTPGAPKVHSYPATVGGLAESGAELVPAAVPRGYRLSEVARHTRATPPVLVYRRGMSAFVVESSPRTPGQVGLPAGSVPARIATFDRATWPGLWSDEYAEFVRIKGGALNGAPAMLYAGVGGPASLYAWTDSQEANVNGDLTRSQLLAVAGSLRPLRGGFYATSQAGLLSTAALMLALLAAVVTAVAWLAARRRAEPDAGPRLGVLAWPLIGLALVVIGAFLTWHALLHNGPAFHVSGWHEPLGRAVAALAIAAICAAAWWLLARRPARVWLRTLAQTLAAFALAGAVLALVYLPPTARFLVSPTVTNTQSGNVGDESLLLRIADSQFSPSATTGLYVALLGALVLFVGVLMMRRRSAMEIVDAAPGESPDRGASA